MPKNEIAENIKQKIYEKFDVFLIYWGDFKGLKKSVEITD